MRTSDAVIEKDAVRFVRGCGGCNAMRGEQQNKTDKAPGRKVRLPGQADVFADQSVNPNTATDL
jgi:hypothetical protein